MVQALATEWGNRHDVVDSDLTRIEPPRPVAPATPPADMSSARPACVTRRSRSRGAAATTSAFTSARSSPFDADGSVAFSVGDPDAALLSPVVAETVAGRRRCWRRARPAPRTARARLREPRRHTVTRRGCPADPRRRRPRRDGARQHARPPDRADGRSRCVAGGRRTQGGPDELLRQARRDARHVRGQRLVDVRLPRSDPPVAARDHGDGRGARRRRRPCRRRRLRRAGARPLVARPGVGVRDDRRSRRLGVAGDDARIRRWSVAPSATSPS